MKMRGDGLARLGQIRANSHVKCRGSVDTRYPELARKCLPRTKNKEGVKTRVANEDSRDSCLKFVWPATMVSAMSDVVLLCCVGVWHCKE